MRMATPPHKLINSLAKSSDFLEVAIEGVRIHERPMNKSPLADCAPEISRPAIGCVPTKRSGKPSIAST